MGGGGQKFSFKILPPPAPKQKSCARHRVGIASNYKFEGGFEEGRDGLTIFKDLVVIIGLEPKTILSSREGGHLPRTYKVSEKNISAKCGSF